MSLHLPQAPSVDLDALGQELVKSELLTDEQSSVVQVKEVLRF